MSELPERDWKSMRKMCDELLERLAKRINRRSREILEAGDGKAIDVYRELYAHIDASDRVIAECFDDWRRSTLMLRVLALRRHGLLTDTDLDRLSDQGRETIHRLEAPSGDFSTG